MMHVGFGQSANSVSGFGKAPIRTRADDLGVPAKGENRHVRDRRADHDVDCVYWERKVSVVRVLCRDFRNVC